MARGAGWLSGPCAAGLALLAALLLSCAPVALCQMESPLKGQGIPQLETDKVFVSAYLDRLLGVDEDMYRFEAVMYFYVSWTDKAAVATITNQTRGMLSRPPTYDCKMYCSNVVEGVLCCDNIYLPAFLFKNAYGFPQDREILYNIYPADNGSMLREVWVQGIYYQPMSFQHYPFDSFDLLTELRFIDPTVLIDTTELYGVKHPGITVLPSSGGKKLFTYGKGDETSSWAVTDFSIESYAACHALQQVDMGAWFDEFSDLSSNPSDPMPLRPVTTNLTYGAVNSDGSPANVYSGVVGQLLAVLITVERFWRPALINSVLPVILVYALAMFVFATDEADVTTRLEIIVTLFLALTAVQFVLSESLPTSSYVVPTQQLVLATYIFLFLLAVEAIIVYHIVERHAKRQQALRRKEAYRRYRKLKAGGKLKGGANPPLSAADSGMSGGMSASIAPRYPHAADAAENGCGGALPFDSSADTPPKGDALGVAPPGADQEAATAAVEEAKPKRKGFGFFAGVFGRGCAQEAREVPGPQRVTSMRQLTADEAYGQYVGHMVDTVFAVIIGVAYAIAAILIFALQNCYIDLFGD